MSNPYEKQVTPGDDIVPVTEGPGDLPSGLARALWIGGAGYITIVTEAGTTRGPIPVFIGLFPIKCLRVLVTAVGPATDVWAIY